MSSKESKIFVTKDSPTKSLTGFFEDEGETGYLYISDNGKIIKHLQIYNKSKELNLKQNDVNVIWSKDGQKCAVAIWGGIQGIIDLNKNLEGRVLMENRFTTPIDNPEWLKGFEEYLK